MAPRTTAPRATGWVIGTVGLAVALSAGAWFLGISPVLDEASAAEQQAQSTRDSNQILQAKINRLAEQFENLDESRAELAALRTQLPTTPELSPYYRTVDELATARQITLVDITTELGFTVVPPVPPAPPAAPEPTEGEETAAEDAEGASGTESAAAPAKPEGPPVIDGFVAVPLTITVLGTYDNVLGFIDALQNEPDRLFLVTGYSGTAQRPADASGGKPPTVLGDVEMIINGYTYVLLDPTAAATVDPEEPVEPTPLLSRSTEPID
jgi:hypothetical protein